MRTFVLGLIWFMMIFPPFSPALAQDDLELLVLSEIEERIAGKMAFYTLERALTEQGGALTEDPRVTAIGRKLIKYADRPQLNYAFYVIEDHSAPQALSLPGGYVLLARSLLEAVCQTDDDIAFILGHEIAHAALRHYADYRLRNQEQVAYVKQLIEQYNFVGEAEQVKSSAELNNVLLPYMMKIRQLKEVEADQFGALYALRAGYQFSASLDVLARLRNLFGETFELEQYPAAVAEDAAAAPTSTHPILSKRIEQLELFRRKAIEVSKLFPAGREALDRGDYREASLVFESILSLFPQSRTAHIGLGVARHLQYWDSSQNDDFLLAYPGALELEHLQLLRGRPDFQTLEQALDEYRLVLTLEPGNKYAVNNLGVALAELKRFDEAETVLREALRLDATQDFMVFNLALTLYQQDQQNPRAETKHEALTLLQQYLRSVPDDPVAQAYFQALQ